MVVLKLASLQHASMFLVPRTQSQAQSRNSVNEWMDGWTEIPPTSQCLVLFSTGFSLAFPCGILKSQNTGFYKKLGMGCLICTPQNTPCKKTNKKKPVPSLGEEEASRHVKWLGRRRLVVFLLPFAGWRGGGGGGSLFFGSLKAGEWKGKLQPGTGFSGFENGRL